MSTPTDTATMRRLVQIRAKQLKDEGTGYLAARNQIAEEIYDAERGKNSPISTIQNAEGFGAMSGGIDLSKLPWKEILAAVSGVVGWIVTRAKNRGAAIKGIADTIAPWVSEVYET